VPLPLPREIVEVVIFRDKDGNVVIEIVSLTPEEAASGLDPSILIQLLLLLADPGDTGTPLPDPLLGEGSTPSVIPPENRTRMATFVVVNKSKSQDIDRVVFNMDNRGYAIESGVNMNDRRSIALGQGEWSTMVEYYLNGARTAGPRNYIIVPSNDPQAIREHYLYFYKTTAGNYDITQDWPPSNLDLEDSFHGDYGAVNVRILNRASASTVFAVQAMQEIIPTPPIGTSIPASFISFEDFNPQGVISRGTSWLRDSKAVSFRDNPEESFVIQNGAPYTIDVFVKDNRFNAGRGFVIVRFEGKNFFLGHTIDIEITDTDVKWAIDNNQAIDEQPEIPVPPPPPPPPGFIPVTNIRIIARLDDGEWWGSNSNVVQTHGGTGPEYQDFLIEIIPHNATNKSAVWSQGRIPAEITDIVKIEWQQGNAITDSALKTYINSIDGTLGDHYGRLRVSVSSRYREPLSGGIRMANPNLVNLAAWINYGVSQSGRSSMGPMPSITLDEIVVFSGHYDVATSFLGVTTAIHGIPFRNPQFPFALVY
jgi:hypothetical protein